MAQIEKDIEREERIHDEIIVDAHGGDEQALSWFYYLERSPGVSLHRRLRRPSTDVAIEGQ